MSLTPHFSLDEFTDSETAHAIGDPNTPDELAVSNLRALAWMLERIRKHLNNKPVVISSGYRAPAVNAAVGGVRNSDHVLGMAADIKVPGYGTAYDVSVALAQARDELQIGQIIYEFGRWTHVSTRYPDNPVNRVLTIDTLGVRPGVHPARSA